MKSIKPGRGPSAMSAFSSVIGVLFGIVWTMAAASMGAPVFFLLFGVLFILAGAAQAVYSFKNATGKNRYSSFDITDSSEESDPLNDRFGNPQKPSGTGHSFCPYCGAAVTRDFDFCPKCGKKLP